MEVPSDEKVRDTVVDVMVSFLKDKVYVDQEVPEEELVHTCYLYYDLVNTVKEEVLETLDKEMRAAAKSAFSKAAPIDASNPDQVDLAGGPRAVDNQTGFNLDRKDD